MSRFFGGAYLIVTRTVRQILKMVDFEKNVQGPFADLVTNLNYPYVGGRF